MMNGTLWYYTEIESNRTNSTITFGNECFQRLFIKEKNYNVPFDNVYISGCNAYNETHYFEQRP